MIISLGNKPRVIELNLQYINKKWYLTLYRFELSSNSLVSVPDEFRISSSVKELCYLFLRNENLATLWIRNSRFNSKYPNFLAPCLRIEPSQTPSVCELNTHWNLGINLVPLRKEWRCERCLPVALIQKTVTVWSRPWRRDLATI